MKVVFFGSSKYVVPILDAINTNHQLTLVVTTELGSQQPVKFYCHTHKIECISVKKAGDLLSNEPLRQKAADIGVVADFGVILPKQTLHLFPKGLINVHPSLLPKFRGPTPAQTAILNGDSKTGVSIIQLDEQMDHGPILAQKEEDISNEDSSKTLYEKLFKESVDLVLDVLNKHAHNTIIFKQQDHNLATYTKALTRDDGFFDYTKTIDQTYFKNFVRAYYPWPGVWTKIKLRPEEDEKVVKFLPGKKIQVEGGKEMEYKDFINGYLDADKLFLEFIGKELNND